MTIHLPQDLADSIVAEVNRGQFASVDDAIAEAVRLLLSQPREARFTGKTVVADELNRQLQEAGLLSRIPPRPEAAGYQEFTPIVIEGEPLSETIIRERR